MKELVVAGVYTLLWMCASSGLILLNKYILSNLDFHYPLALSRCGPAAAAGLGRDERPRHLTLAFLRRRQPRPGLLVAGVHGAHPRAEDAQAGNQGRDPRILPLPHLSARLPHGTRAGPRARLSAQPPWQSVSCGADVARHAGGDAGLWKPSVLVPLGVVHPDPQGCDAGDDHGHPGGRAPGQAVHAGASLPALRTRAEADSPRRSLSRCPSSPSEPPSRRGASWHSPCWASSS